ncbi:MAG: hypothetical protein AAGG02_13755 [Cyanobacteria bacterium P01_H01_bin.15]
MSKISMLGNSKVAIVPGVRGQKVPVTAEEACVITAFDRFGESYEPELATTSRLKPRDFYTAIKHLEQKNYLTKQKPHKIKLTSKGRVLRTQLKRAKI